jgi:hypothetical protein
VPAFVIATVHVPAVSFPSVTVPPDVPNMANWPVVMDPFMVATMMNAAIAATLSARNAPIAVPMNTRRLFGVVAI